MSGWWGRLGLRSRLLTVGLLGVAVALLAGGVLLHVSMSVALTRATDEDSRASAREIAKLVDGGQVPDPIPVTGSQIVQVLDEDNAVVTVSATGDRLVPLVTAAERARLTAGEVVTVPGSRAARSGELRVVAVEAGPEAGPVLVVAAAPTADVESSTRTLRTLLLVFFPLVLLALGLIAWRVIGSALRPVDELRLGADRIGEETADERLPVPSARDELHALATTLNGMLDRLATARATQRAFVADAAHELRSPLAALRTQLEVAQRLREGGGLPDDLLHEVERLSTLVEDLLFLARTGDGGAPPRSPVEVVALLREVAARYGDAGVPVRVSPAAGPVEAFAAADDVLRAVMNLVDNAVRHAGSEVELAARSVATHVEIRVRDDGHGIPESDRERVFDRFARLDEARDRDSGGSGLGLAITRELAHRNDGEVRLDDARPGVLVVLTLPRAGE